MLLCRAHLLLVADEELVKWTGVVRFRVGGEEVDEVESFVEDHVDDKDERQKVESECGRHLQQRIKWSLQKNQ